MYKITIYTTFSCKDDGDESWQGTWKTTWKEEKDDRGKPFWAEVFYFSYQQLLKMPCHTNSEVFDPDECIIILFYWPLWRMHTEKIQ